MEFSNPLKKIVIGTKAHRILQRLLDENPQFAKIFVKAEKPEDAILAIKKIAEDYLKNKSYAYEFYKNQNMSLELYQRLTYRDYAAIRILDYIDYSHRIFDDLSHPDKKVQSDPFRILWYAIKKGTGGANTAFFTDMLYLFRQFRGKLNSYLPSKRQIHKWMERYPSGLDTKIIELRQKNKERIINVLVDKLDNFDLKDSKYYIPKNTPREDKIKLFTKWWDNYDFHLKFAIRDPELLNELLDFSLNRDTFNILKEAKKKGIPFFVNPYYLSLINVTAPHYAAGADLSVRDYVLYNKRLIKEYGKIKAWEKEDIVKPGEPNAAGWILPLQNNIHRRYPEVAILIPDTMGRACGGLCASCQRMYNFQRGNLNFDLEALKPTEKWNDKLKILMDYYRNDSRLADILITGGDALMSANASLQNILDSILDMAKNKQNDNLSREKGKKYAEIKRIRLGTRLPAYLPQRINDELCEILADFKNKALKVGIEQFVIQTHFQSPLEITPVSKMAVKKLIDSGWIVTNQLVFTISSSRRGHTAKLRKLLNGIGVIPYYTFTVKGFQENYYNFSPNARSVQEIREEKYFGKSSLFNKFDDIASIKNTDEYINDILKEKNLPFIATDRNVMNLPGIGKSLTFRVIGITAYGRRILRFEHDHSRTHSPIINNTPEVFIVETKTIYDYLQQLDSIGEDITEYESIYGFSINLTEEKHKIFDILENNIELTPEITNLTI